MSDAHVANAGDRRQVREADRIERDIDKQRLEDLRAVLATGPGRRVLMRIMLSCGVLQVNRATNSDVYRIAGKQELGLQIRDLVNEVDPMLFVQMLGEQMEAELRASGRMTIARKEQSNG